MVDEPLGVAQALEADLDVDAMVRKAKAGHASGGGVFGYDNVEVLGPDGKRSHVERRINDAEGAVVRRIFDLCNGVTAHK